MRKFIFFIIVVLSSSFLFAQKGGLKWGKIPTEDLAITAYEKDQNADALVLDDVGKIAFESTPQGNLLLMYTRHRRVKILSREGFDHANVSIVYYSDNDVEKVVQLKAQITNPDGKKTDLSKPDFYNEKISDYRSRKKFTFPDVQVGSVIEYRYTIESEDFLSLKEWYFQEDIPIRNNSLVTEIPDVFEYATNVQQNLGFASKDQERFTITQNVNVAKWDNSSMMTPGGGVPTPGMQQGTMKVNMFRTTYIVKDIPGLKEEPFITTMDDYYFKITHQLKATLFNNIRKPVISDWENLAEKQMISDNFGTQLNERNIIPILKKYGTSYQNLESDEEKMKAVYDFVTDKISWSGHYSIRTDMETEEALNLGKANSCEINLLVTALLQNAGVKAYPALTSTRSHGKMQQLLPFVDQFNHTICYVKSGEKTYLIDATEGNKPFDLLPVNSLNQHAWVIYSRNQHEWVDVIPARDVQAAKIVANLSSEGTMTGTGEFTFKNYSATQNREDLKGQLKEEFAASFFGEFESDVTVSEVALENKMDYSKSFIVKTVFEGDELAEKSGDLIYLNGLLGQGYTANPFKQQTREFPVDFAYPINENIVIEITIPEGYAVESLPKAAVVSLDNKGGKFQFVPTENGNKITIMSRHFINETYFGKESYSFVKAFFDKIVESHSQQIVIKKR